ncbi:MAG: homoprotocatechuate degradation operon regulator HpaR [Luminiphilus sp.]|jgi:homoprotocatechuate degradation regulator HpaR|nr:homoprotocatechuate degradation operon regulator HpaR [Luminiphilus sp.]MDG1460441.1 homoprotocatechuate degradation operon regulator HpaR [Luminiphilus sp.]
MTKRQRPRAVAPEAGKTVAANNMRRFDQSLPMTLLKAHEAVLRTFIPHLRAHDLSTQQWRVMRALAESESLDVSELASACSLLRPSVSRIVQNLEGRKILQRQPCDRDSRRSLVSITSFGRELIAEIAPESEARYQYIESQYGAENLSGLYDLLNELIEALDRAAPPFGTLGAEGETPSDCL